MSRNNKTAVWLDSHIVLMESIMTSKPSSKHVQRIVRLNFVRHPFLDFLYLPSPEDFSFCWESLEPLENPILSWRVEHYFIFRTVRRTGDVRKRPLSFATIMLFEEMFGVSFCLHSGVGKKERQASNLDAYRGRPDSTCSAPLKKGLAIFLEERLIKEVRERI